ncbi:MAG: hypothetical protein ACRYFU_05965 [Janthinobacterium lividum]
MGYPVRKSIGQLASLAAAAADESMGRTSPSRVSLAQTGSPQAAGLPLWARFTAVRGEYVQFASSSTRPVAADDVGGRPYILPTGSALPAAR